MNPLETLDALQNLGQAIQSAAVISLALVMVIIAVGVAYLSAKAHGSTYATFSLRAVATWYVRLIQLIAVLAVAAGLASLLNVGIGAAVGSDYSFSEGIDSGGYPSIVYRALVAVGAGLIVIYAHMMVRRSVEPNNAAAIARRFLVAALTIIFGVTSALLLFGTGISLVEYHVGPISEGASSPHPGRAISGLVIAAVFWVAALLALRREFKSTEE